MNTFTAQRGLTGGWAGTEAGGGSRVSAGPGLRVVLVGRTGLDDALRREAGIELLRARDPFEAVGELGTPFDDDSPKDAAVIVAPGTVTEDELRALTRALRAVDERAVVVGLLENAASRAAAPEPERFGLDAWVVPPVTGGVLRLLVQSRGGREGAAAPVVPPPVPAAARAPAALRARSIEDVRDGVGEGNPSLTLGAREGARDEAATLGAREGAGNASATPGARGAPGNAGSPSLTLGVLGDFEGAPVAALLTGGDVVTACLGVIRARAGLGDAAFVPTGAASDDPRASCEVSHKGHVFGRLVANADAGVIEPAATWLASWLALREQHSQLRRAAFTDPLTGAWNRRYFDGFLERAIGEARASRRDLTVLLFDIDDFKRYNDAHGHGAGDEILTETVRLLKSAVRAGDKVCRVGGDEFAVIFHEPEGPREANSHHPSSVVELATRFQRLISQARFSKLGAGAPGVLGISGGLATFPWDGHDAASLLSRADALLLESKAAGKNVFRYGAGARRSLGAGEQTSA